MTAIASQTSTPRADAATAASQAGVVAYVAGTFPLRSETFVYREVRGLRQRGWIVRAVSLNKPPKENDSALSDLAADLTVVYGSEKRATISAATVEMIAHPLRSARTLVAGLKDAIFPGEPARVSSRVKGIGQAIAGIGLARRLRRIGGVQHVHCHFAHAPASVGMYAAMQLGVGFSFTGHANDLFERRVLLKTKLRRAAFVSCISRWHRDWYRQIVPDSRHRDEVIRCGVDVNAWKPVGEQSANPDKVLRVLTLCRLVEKKGVDTLIQAIAKLPPGSVDLTIAGDGPDRPRLLGLAKELDCAASVRWLGAVDNEKVPALLASADVFALPCRPDARGDKDGIPVVLMEAMACGVPVIGGDLAAIRELIDDGINGFLVGASDASALAKKLEMLAADVPQRRMLAQAGRRRVEEEFALSANLDRLERRLSQCCLGTQV